jgi:hypothetical protein
MKRLSLSFFFLSFFIFVSYADDLVKLKVVDDANAPLSHSDIFVESKWHLTTDDSGFVNIPLTYCTVGDTIQIRFMGFENQSIVISPSFLQTDTEQTYQLTPTSYALEEVTMVGNAGKLFKKKKRNMLLPYSGKHIVDVIAHVNYVDSIGVLQVVSGRLQINFDMYAAQQEIIQNTCTTDSILLYRITRGLVLAAYKPYDCCFAKLRKMNDIYYLGMQENADMFRFTVKPKYITHKRYRFQPKDEVSSLVSVDQNGFISKIETRVDVKSGASKSHNLSVNYGEYKQAMVPRYIDLSLIDEQMHIELECSYE